jgi:hypothetical protein
MLYLTLYRGLSWRIKQRHLLRVVNFETMMSTLTLKIIVAVEILLLYAAQRCNEEDFVKPLPTSRSMSGRRTTSTIGRQSRIQSKAGGVPL